VWFTGLPAAGKTTLASALCDRLAAAGRPAVLLDGDALRATVSADLGFTAADRREQSRRVAALALDAARQGSVAAVALVSPFRDARDAAGRAHEEAGIPFLEVHVDTPLAECVARDPRGLYRRAGLRQIAGLTGMDAPYEPPLQAALRTNGASVEQATERVIRLLEAALPVISPPVRAPASR
jgi:bifunctional enzyme CysN/CysC